MRPETKEKLKAINRDVPGIIKQKALEKVSKAKNPAAVYLAVIEIVLVFGLAIAFLIFIDPEINVISEQRLPQIEKIALFLLFSAIAIMLFLYNKKFFAQAARGTKWQWKWKTKR